jgi:pimeloyl-ACP methyl ester carboxylesterase
MILNTSVTGEGPPLVLLHGLFGAGKNLGALARGLAPDARVISMDLRNHGDSPHADAMDFASMAGDVLETCASLGIARARVAGHSLGGKTAMMLALTQPEFVDRLAVLDIAPVAYDHHYDTYVNAMRNMVLTPSTTRHAADAELAKVVSGAPMRAFLLNNLILGENPHWRLALREIGAAMPDLLTWRDPPGPAYAGPTLFLHGAESDYVGPDAIAPIRRLFPNARLEAVEGASHWLHAEKPQQIIASLKDFFFP